VLAAVKAKPALRAGARFARSLDGRCARRRGIDGATECLDRGGCDEIEASDVDDIVEMVARVHKLSKEVSRRDSELAKQIKTASASVGLNSGEGLHARGGNHTVRLESAMCSGREVIMALRIAGAAGYLAGAVVAKEVDDIDRIVATLYKLTYHRR